ncbi:MAG: helicase-related protein, partial [Promethearchaeota archaeon]
MENSTCIVGKNEADAFKTSVGNNKNNIGSKDDSKGNNKEKLGENLLKLLRSQYLRKGIIEPRTYQLDIAGKAVGKSFLVVLPTGMGKTPISAIITANTYDLFPEDSKIIMLAPTKPLIVQQAKRFLEFLNIPKIMNRPAKNIDSNEYELEENADKSDYIKDNLTDNQISWEDITLTGSVKPKDRKKIFEKSRLLFYTPQTLRNDLLYNSKNNKPALYNLKKVCLIIFDEAHRARGNYAYCEIARLFKDMNPDGLVLGLTASPGASKEKIRELCDNLYIPSDNYVIKTRSDKDVKEYAPELQTINIGVEMSSDMAYILELLNSLKLEKLKLLAGLGVLTKKIRGEDVPITINDEKDLNFIYQKNLVDLASSLVRRVNALKGKPRLDVDKYLFDAISVNAQCLRIFHMIKITESQGLNVLYEHLKRFIKEAASRKSKAAFELARAPQISIILKKLRYLEENHSAILIHPKLIKIAEILKNEFERNGSTKIIIFTKFRDTVNIIVKFLKAIPKIKPIKFVGQSSRSARDKGLTQKEQLMLLEKFKKGVYNVLVATSVAEEGLDIAECDMVFFYEPVASEIKLIQRRGRTARRTKGVVYIFYCKGTSDEISLIISNKKLRNMHKNLGRKDVIKKAEVNTKSNQKILRLGDADNPINLNEKNIKNTEKRNIRKRASNVKVKPENAKDKEKAEKAEKAEKKEEDNIEKGIEKGVGKGIEKGKEKGIEKGIGKGIEKKEEGSVSNNKPQKEKDRAAELSKLKFLEALKNIKFKNPQKAQNRLMNNSNPIVPPKNKGITSTSPTFNSNKNGNNSVPSNLIKDENSYTNGNINKSNNRHYPRSNTRRNSYTRLNTRDRGQQMPKQFFISKNLSPRYGIRKILSGLGIKYLSLDINSLIYADLGIPGELLVKFVPYTKFNDFMAAIINLLRMHEKEPELSINSGDIRSTLVLSKSHFTIVFLDLISLVDKIGEIRNKYISKLNAFSQLTSILTIPIDTQNDIEVILKPIIDK